MIIYFTVKHEYGNRRIYPACSKGQMFCDLAGTRTFSPEAIKIIKSLGYEFKQQLLEI
jgi:hypothetical protein